MDDLPDIPLDNFGAETEVATSPVASEAETPSEQTTQTTETTGSEVQQEAQPVKTEDNPIVEEEKSGRPEKQERLQSRFGELTGKIKERDAELEDLRAQLARNQALAEVQPMQPDAEGQYDIQALQQYQARQAQAIASAEVSQLRGQIERESIANRYDSEGQQIEAKYKTDFESNPVHQENIEALIAETVQLNLNNPTALKQISPLKIAERYMRGIESERRVAQSQSAQNLQTLKTEQAVLPESAASSLDPGSDEALAARVADIKF